MSPRAACRLETLGFSETYDYVPGKAEWLGHGLPVEGPGPDEERVVRYVRDDVVTCGLDEAIGDVRGRVEASPCGFALVVSEGGCLLGRLRRAELEGDAERRAEGGMEAGPSTVRPTVSAHELAQRLAEHDLKFAVVTRADGTLMGVVRRSELEA